METPSPPYPLARISRTPPWRHGQRQGGNIIEVDCPQTVGCELFDRQVKPFEQAFLPSLLMLGRNKWSTSPRQASKQVNSTSASHQAVTRCMISPFLTRRLQVTGDGVYVEVGRYIVVRCAGSTQRLGCTRAGERRAKKDSCRLHRYVTGWRRSLLVACLLISAKTF
ncbi:hypothetical protein LX32DRAFT_30354 [Colletotrichum zoysiae]|uniref:Uncharacterized protein n=1 Tax=Colletotrichum zoysiae TaxID=1216348 RepID=A0AAD9HD78_9PEZI|nr:hypothetical protein LX32DRAFT_30354 [Colletotrichum zoysiae]